MASVKVLVMSVHYNTNVKCYIIHHYYNLLVTFTTVVLKRQLVSESPGNLIKTDVIGPHTQSF